jgi:hypothetical protein
MKPAHLARRIALVISPVWAFAFFAYLPSGFGEPRAARLTISEALLMIHAFVGFRAFYLA